MAEFSNERLKDIYPALEDKDAIIAATKVKQTLTCRSVLEDPESARVRKECRSSLTTLQHDNTSQSIWEAIRDHSNATIRQLQGSAPASGGSSGARPWNPDWERRCD